MALSVAQAEGWLKIVSLPNFAPSPPDLRVLDAGETEALRLAIATSATYVLMDEKEGRKCAAGLGIRTIGVLGVLMSAKQSGAILSLHNEISRLRQQAGFFIDGALEARVLAMVGE